MLHDQMYLHNIEFYLRAHAFGAFASYNFDSCHPLAMTSDIEMKTLWSQRTPQTSAGEDIDEENDSGISTWAIFTAGMYAILPVISSSSPDVCVYRFFLVALCFIGSPRLLLFLSETTPTVDRRMTPLEYFLAVHFGILLISVSAALILNVRLSVAYHSRSLIPSNRFRMIPPLHILY